ncbi:MAG: porin family protein [Flavobacteriales bacterium]
MKKLLLISCTLLFALVINAQSEGDSDDFRKFKFGFKVEPNFSWMTPGSDELVSDGVSLRANFGLDMDFMFSDNYAFSTGINLMGMGGNLTYLDNETRDNDPFDYLVSRQRNYKLRYMEIPLTLKLRTQEIGYLTYWGQFGLGVGFITRARADDEIKFFLEQDPSNTAGYLASIKEDELDENIDISSDVIPARASLIVGAGADYSLSGSTALSFGIIFNNGFTNVLKGNGIEKDDKDQPVVENGEFKKFDLKATSSQIQLRVGLIF